MYSNHDFIFFNFFIASQYHSYFFFVFGFAFFTFLFLFYFNLAYFLFLLVQTQYCADPTVLCTMDFQWSNNHIVQNLQLQSILLSPS